MLKPMLIEIAEGAIDGLILTGVTIETKEGFLEDAEVELAVLNERGDPRYFHAFYVPPNAAMDVYNPDGIVNDSRFSCAALPVLIHNPNEVKGYSILLEHESGIEIELGIEDGRDFVRMSTQAAGH